MEADKEAGDTQKRIARMRQSAILPDHVAMNAAALREPWL
jgi:hypothetical protein